MRLSLHHQFNNRKSKRKGQGEINLLKLDEEALGYFIVLSACALGFAEFWVLNFVAGVFRDVFRQTHVVKFLILLPKGECLR